jgi:hypothetical protein
MTKRIEGVPVGQVALSGENWYKVQRGIMGPELSQVKTTIESKIIFFEEKKGLAMIRKIDNQIEDMIARGFEPQVLILNCQDYEIMIGYVTTLHGEGYGHLVIPTVYKGLHIVVNPFQKHLRVLASPKDEFLYSHVMRDVKTKQGGRHDTTGKVMD